MTEHPHEDDEDLGFVMIGETQIAIVDVHLCAGRITLMARAVSPFPGAHGKVTVYGHDLQSIMHMPDAVSIPPLLEPDRALMFSIPLGVDGIVRSSVDDVHPDA